MPGFDNYGVATARFFFRAVLCFIVLTLHFLSREQVTALSPRNFHNFSEGERKVFLVLC